MKKLLLIILLICGNVIATDPTAYGMKLEDAMNKNLLSIDNSSTTLTRKQFDKICDVMIMQIFGIREQTASKSLCEINELIELLKKNNVNYAGGLYMYNYALAKCMLIIVKNDEYDEILGLPILTYSVDNVYALAAKIKAYQEFIQYVTSS